GDGNRMQATAPIRVERESCLSHGTRASGPISSERKGHARTNEHHMKTSLRSIIRLAAFIVLTSVGWMRANGQAPSGAYEYTLKAQDGYALWNFSGAYSWPFYYTLQLRQDAKGGLTAIIEDGGPTNVALVGAVTGSASRLKMRLRSTTGFPEYL